MHRYLFSAFLILVSSHSFAATPVIFDTDIGSDIDDTWALSLILKTPELDLKLVTTATEDTTYRAKVAAKFLQVAGRSDIPVGIGLGGGNTLAFQQPWVADYQLEDYPGEIATEGVAKLISVVRESDTPVTIIVAGPMHNIAEALKRAPDITTKVHIVGMHGSVDTGYGNAATPSAEYNVANNVPAFQAVLAANWLSFTITPLDTCGDITIGGSDFQALKTSKDVQLQTIFENYAIWAKLVTWEKVDYQDVRTSTLYDAVAVYLAMPEHDFLPTESLTIRVNKQGIMHRDNRGHKLNVAMQWHDKAAFYQWLTQRLLSD